MTTSFQYYWNNLPLKHQSNVFENKLFVKIRHNTISITESEWEVMF